MKRKTLLGAAAALALLAGCASRPEPVVNAPDAPEPVGVEAPVEATTDAGLLMGLGGADAPAIGGVLGTGTGSATDDPELMGVGDDTREVQTGGGGSPVPRETTASNSITTPDQDGMARRLPTRGVRLTSGEDTACDTGGMNAFAWPAPRPSAYIVIPRLRIFPGEDAGASHTLGDVGDRLESALIDAGYDQYGYQAIGCSGFALVTRMEQIDRDARPVAGTGRFQLPQEDRSWSLGGFVRQLIGAPPGYYRQIVFAATDADFDPGVFADAPTGEQLNAIMAAADRRALPTATMDKPFASGHRLIALIYEFRKDRDADDAVLVRPSRFAGRVHIERTGIYDRLGE